MIGVWGEELPSSLLLASLELSDTQSPCALNTSMPQSCCTFLLRSCEGAPSAGRRGGQSRRAPSGTALSLLHYLRPLKKNRLITTQLLLVFHEPPTLNNDQGRESLLDLSRRTINSRRPEGARLLTIQVLLSPFFINLQPLEK